MSAPRDIVREYITGSCWNLAVAMQELTGLPVWAVYDADGHEVHSFVFDETTNMAYDIRGALSISEVIKGPWRTGKTIGPFDVARVSVTKHNARKAKTVAKRHLNNLLELV